MAGCRIIIMVLCLTQVAGAAVTAPAALTVQIAADTKTFTLPALRRALPVATVRVYNPAYEREMTYRGFWFDDVLRVARFPMSSEHIAISVACKDGYIAVMAPVDVGKHRWLLAFEEAGGGWTRLHHGRENVSPAPWYLVGIDKKSFETTPWPYQVTTISTLDH